MLNSPTNTTVHTSTLEARAAQAAVKIMESTPKYHWKRDPMDTRDKIYQPVSLPTTPVTVDLRNYASPIEIGRAHV